MGTALEGAWLHPQLSRSLHHSLDEEPLEVAEIVALIGWPQGVRGGVIHRVQEVGIGLSIPGDGGRGRCGLKRGPGGWPI